MGRWANLRLDSVDLARNNRRCACGHNGGRHRSRVCKPRILGLQTDTQVNAMKQRILVWAAIIAISILWTAFVFRGISYLLELL